MTDIEIWDVFGSPPDIYIFTDPMPDVKVIYLKYPNSSDTIFRMDQIVSRDEIGVYWESERTIKPVHVPYTAIRAASSCMMGGSRDGDDVVPLNMLYIRQGDKFYNGEDDNTCSDIEVLKKEILPCWCNITIENRVITLLSGWRTAMEIKMLARHQHPHLTEHHTLFTDGDAISDGEYINIQGGNNLDAILTDDV